MPTLREHQHETVAKLLTHRRGAVCDEMRVGKTPPVIVAAQRLGLEKILIHCPSSAVPVWEDAWQEWWPNGPKPRIESYRRLTMNPLGHLDYLGYELYVPDEFHRCRKFSAQQTRIAMAIANRTPRIWPLSGTPMPDSPMDLYPLLKAVWPDELRKIGIKGGAGYREMFCEYWYDQKYDRFVPIRAKNVPLLQDILSRVILVQRSFAEVSPHLPQLQWETHTLEEYPTITGSVAVSAADVIRGIEENRHHGPGEIAKARHELGVQKAGPAAELIDDELVNRDYDKVVVLAYHRAVIDILHRNLDQHGVALVDGRSSAQDRRDAVEEFQAVPETRVFLGQINAVQEALDLSAAHHVIFVEQDWLPDNNRQAAARIMNINKDHPVYARMLFAPGTVDSAVRRALRRRMETQGEVFNR